MTIHRELNFAANFCKWVWVWVPHACVWYLEWGQSWVWIIPLTCTIWFNSALVDEAVHVWIYDGRIELQAQFLNFLKLFFIWRGTCGGISVGFHYPTPPCLLIQFPHHFTGTGWTASPRDLSVSDPTHPVLRLQPWTHPASTWVLRIWTLALNACIVSNSATSYLPSSHSGPVPSQIWLACQRAAWAREWVKTWLGKLERQCLRIEKKRKIGV